jgi:PhzF family phenazine biosynthesis protein
MPHTVRVFQVDAFTSQRFCGNPAGVVLEADGLSDAQMQAIARELNNGDTAFVLLPDGADHDLRVRFFTPRREAAFVGHATVAVHAVRAALQLSPVSRQKQRSGIVDIDTVAGSSPARIAIHQPPLPLQRPLQPAEVVALLAALSVEPGQLDPRCPPTIAGDSSKRILLALQDGDHLAHLQPDLSRLSALSDQLGVPGFFVYSLRPRVPEVFSEARMFCPALGIPEDPVSGNAHAMLGAFLFHQGLLAGPQRTDTDSDTIEFTGAQGHHVGRPGRVLVALDVRQQQLESVSIIGEAVIVFSATLDFE